MGSRPRPMDRPAVWSAPPHSVHPEKEFRAVSGYPVHHHGCQLHHLRPARRNEKRVPLSAIVAMTGFSRLTLYGARYSGRVSDDMVELLTPLVRRFEAVKLASGAPARGATSRTAGRIIETWTGGACWREDCTLTQPWARSTLSKLCQYG